MTAHQYNLVRDCIFCGFKILVEHVIHHFNYVSLNKLCPCIELVHVWLWSWASWVIDLTVFYHLRASSTFATTKLRSQY